MNKKLYVFENDFNLIKIGISVDPSRRAKEVSNNSGIKVKLLYSFDTEGQLALSVEQFLHKEFSFYRNKGEWFEYHALPLLLKKIKEIKNNNWRLPRPLIYNYVDTPCPYKTSFNPCDNEIKNKILTINLEKENFDKNIYDNGGDYQRELILKYNIFELSDRESNYMIHNDVIKELDLYAIYLPVSNIILDTKLENTLKKVEINNDSSYTMVNTGCNSFNRLSVVLINGHSNAVDYVRKSTNYCIDVINNSLSNLKKDIMKY